MNEGGFKPIIQEIRRTVDNCRCAHPPSSRAFVDIHKNLRLSTLGTGEGERQHTPAVAAHTSLTPSSPPNNSY